MENVVIVEEEENATDSRLKEEEEEEEDPTTTTIVPCCLLELPLGEAAASFDLEKAVCSHGLFMMAPNYWDPFSKTLSRPLSLSLLLLHDADADADADNVRVRISHPSHSPLSLHLHVYASHSLSLNHKQALLGQVVRMLRLSESDERNVREFRNIVESIEEGKAGEGEAEYLKSFSGRVFRSPTLFEDIVKCILLCNCHWSRTLSMAKALCELQLELLHHSSSENDFKPCPASNELSTADSHLVSDLQFSDGREAYAYDRIGNFPSPRELANLDETFLAKRCNLGYRASRILKLAQGIVEGRIQLRQLEEVCKEANLSSYDKLAEQLSEIDGIGPFTCANVLMCMGFFHVIPTDSETVRHLKKVHARKSTIQTVKRDVEKIYGKFAPFQFLAYWAEMWHFYEQRFGKLSVMPYSDYKLITASNMRTKGSCKKKRTKTS